MGGGAKKPFSGVSESYIELAGEISLSGKVGVVEESLDGAGAIFGGVDEGDGGAGDFGDGGFEEGVVGAAEDEGVDAFGEQRFEVAREDLVGHRVVEQTFLDERNEK